MSAPKPQGISSRWTRRRFLRSAALAPPAAALGASGVVALGGAAGRSEAATPTDAAPGGTVDHDGNGPRLEKLTDHLWLYHGAIQTGVVVHEGRALVIDCGEGVADALKAEGVTAIDQLLLTHHHRDQACGAAALVAAGAKVAVPAGERAWFENPETFWNDDRNLYHVYRNFRPGPQSLIEPLPVDRALDDGQRLEFGPATIEVISTPGHSEASASYLVSVDGRRVVFCGDLMADEGKLWDVWSLQRGFSSGGASIGAYHGFLGDRWRLAESLQRVKALGADLAVPSHGRPIREVARAVDLLVARLEACYENYVAISALRHYFPKLFSQYEGRPGQMPIRPGFAPPDCLRHHGTTWLLVSRTGGALVMDCGGAGVVAWLKKLLEAGEIKSVDALWVTHYHADHTDGIAEFQKTFDCPAIMDRRLADVLARPAAWRLPCLAPEPMRVDRRCEDGESWQWHEFKLTSLFYPGQTLYHDALLAESGELRMLFVGDSHTPSGIDDYCAQNRNWLGRGVGFQFCLDRIERIAPTHIFNCHVDDAFAFTPEEIRFMRDVLDRRERLFGELVDWEHANYGLDPSWVRADPYLQRAAPGATVTLDAMVTNHSAEPRRARVRAVLPRRLGGRATGWVEADVPPKTARPLVYDFPIRLEVKLPEDAPPGRYVVAIDVEYAGRRLPQWTEAIVDVVG